MNQDDPFMAFSGDRTVILPTPGARMASPRTSFGAEMVEPDDSDMAPSGLSRLLAFANPLLNLVPTLRSTLDHPNPEQLRRDLSRAVREFESRARAANIPSEHVVAARYILCTLLDEVVAGTPWGPRVWVRQSLLVEFHNDAWGGEKVFQLLSKLAANPTKEKDLLELIYVCLQLGFEGRYRVADGGKGQLEALRDRLYQLLRKYESETDRSLSPNWRGVAKTHRRWIGALPLWVIAAVCAVAFVGIYLLFSFSLNRKSDQLAADIAAIKVSTAPPRARPVEIVEPRLSRFLSEEIARGLVEVRDTADRSVVTIRGDGLFEPGSDVIAHQYESLLMRVADALTQVPGQVTVAGHTDNVPIRTLRFPSNWELSRARAESVKQLLATRVPVQRLRSDGRADTEPLVTNDTPQNRARNRRVDITLFVAIPTEAQR
jgi:type VI secretion system protein ImpK